MPYYHVTQPDGTKIGPHDEDTIKELISQGQLSDKCMVWHKGMPAWEPIHKHFAFPEQTTAPSPELDSTPSTTPIKQKTRSEKSVSGSTGGGVKKAIAALLLLAALGGGGYYAYYTHTTISPEEARAYLESRQIFPSSYDAELVRTSESGNADIVKNLLIVGTSTNAQEQALIKAVIEGHADICNLLLEAGVNVNATAENGLTPLLMASNVGHNDVINVLIKKGANVNEQTKEGVTPLMASASKGHTDVMKSLLAAGASIDATTTEDHFTPLMFAATSSHMEAVKLLIARGANVNHKTSKGVSVLMLVCAAEASNTQLELVKLLTSAGADVNYVNNGQDSALSDAKNNIPLMQLLAELGAVNKTNPALHTYEH